MKQYLQINSVIALLFLFGCQKPINDIPGLTTPPVDSISAPFVNRDWQMDTIVLTPPADYNMLSDSDKIFFNQNWAWLQHAIISFNSNGTVNSSKGDWDFGYQTWKLINNDDDIEVTLSDGKDTLRSWFMDSAHFSYQININTNLPCTYRYK